MQKARKVALAKALGNFVKSLGRPVVQVAAMVGADAVAAYGDEYRSRGFNVVMRPWGAEVFKP